MTISQGIIPVKGISQKTPHGTDGRYLLRASADGCGPFTGARTGGDYHCGQSQDSHGSWLPPHAEDVDRTRLFSCLSSTRLPMTQMPTASSGGARISRRVVTHNHHRRDARVEA